MKQVMVIIPCSCSQSRRHQQVHRKEATFCPHFGKMPFLEKHLRQPHPTIREKQGQNNHTIDPLLLPLDSQFCKLHVAH